MTTKTPKSYLTLSAATGLDRQADRSTTGAAFVALRGSCEPTDDTSIIDAELRRIRVARWSGSRRIASERIERLIDFVWGPDAGGAA